VFLGPPGTGKTFMVDALFRTLEDMGLFTALLHPQMVVEQRLGVQRVKKVNYRPAEVGGLCLGGNLRDKPRLTSLSPLQPLG